MSLRPWLLLLAAVCTEIVGVTVMKLIADQYSLLILLFMYAMIALSFYLLAKVVMYLPLGLSYALWESFGIIAITFIGYFLFNEHLGLKKSLGIAMLLAGVIVIKFATPDSSMTKNEMEAKNG